MKFPKSPMPETEGIDLTSYQASPFSSSPSSGLRNFVEIFDVRQIGNELVVVEDFIGIGSIVVAALRLDDRHLDGQEEGGSLMGSCFPDLVIFCSSGSRGKDSRVHH